MADAYWDNVVLLFNGADAGPTDLSLRRNVPVQTEGLDVVSTSMFGLGSLTIDADRGYALYGAHSDFSTAGDFTVEFFVWPLEPGYILGQGLSQAMYWTEDKLYISGFGVETLPAFDVPAGEFTAVALSRVGNVTYVYLDGELERTSEDERVNTDPVLKLGLFEPGQYVRPATFDGYLSQFRWTKGVGRYDATELPNVDDPYEVGAGSGGGGSGLPEGGTEGQILMIVGGVPTWVTIEGIEVPPPAGPPHAFWRLWFPDKSGFSELNVRELVLSSEPGGAQLGQESTAFQHGSYFGDDAMYAARVFNTDDLYWDMWLSPAWVGCELAEPAAIAEYSIRISFTDRAPAHWELQYSDDNVTWEVADARESITWTSTNQVLTFSVSY